MPTAPRPATRDSRHMRRFELMDTDGNGTLEESDYTRIADRLVAASGAAEDAPEAEEVRRHYLTLWRTLRAKGDVDLDGKVTPEEYRASVVQSFVDGDGYDQLMTPLAQAVVALFDDDGDDALTHDQYLAMTGALGLEPDSAAEAHGIMADEDGKVPARQFLEALREFYVAPAPGPAGSVLFGSPGSPGSSGSSGSL
ncbi:EF-hand domain-containing protein [Streptomyces daliensis]